MVTSKTPFRDWDSSIAGTEQGTTVVVSETNRPL